jgi:hypothetical protein
VKVSRGQEVPELVKDIKTNDQCPPVSICLFVVPQLLNFFQVF